MAEVADGAIKAWMAGTSPAMTARVRRTNSKPVDQQITPQEPKAGALAGGFSELPELRASLCAGLDRLEDRARGVGAGRAAVGERISRSSRESASSWAVARRAVAHDVGERRAERGRRAVALQELRDRALAEDEVGQQDRGNLDEIFELLLDAARPCRRRPSGRPPARVRASPCPRRRAPRARRESRRIWRPRRARSSARSGQRAARARTSRSTCGSVGSTTANGPTDWRSDLERAAEVRHQPADLRAARARQHDDERRTRPRGGAPPPRSAAIRRGARSADGRHRRSAGRRAADAPRARTAAAPARNRHRRASPWRGPGRQAQTLGLT